MKTIKLKRVYFSEYTIGHLTLDGKKICDTLEPKVADVNHDGKIDGGEKKILKKTAIPFGRYEINPYHSPRLNCKVFLLKDVPGFEFVEIHPGNSLADTHGCILTGDNKIKGRVVNSRKALARLFSALAPALDAGEKIYLEIE